MKKRRIPSTDIEVSPLCLGTMTFGTPVGEDDAIRIIHHAQGVGMNFIDTANMYEGYARSIGSAGGVAEEIVGKAIAGRRGQFVIATKVGMKVGQAPADEGTSPGAIAKHLDLSLARLRVDCIDIYYLHKPDPDTPMLACIEALEKAARAGKIRHYGVSNFSAPELSQLLSVAGAAGLPRPVIVQPGLSLLNQEVCSDLLPLCEKERIAAAPYQILQGGLLTGKYRRGEPVPRGSRKAEKSTWVWDLTDGLFDKLEAFEADARAAGLPLSHYAIRWVLDRPAVVCGVIGVKRTSQIDNAIAAIT
jgi:aryl-alcohol dehydrogenase-like predicted oxidoreductase